MALVQGQAGPRPNVTIQMEGIRVVRHRSVSEDLYCKMAKNGTADLTKIRLPDRGLVDYNDIEISTSAQTEVTATTGQGNIAELTVFVCSKADPACLLGLDATLKLGLVLLASDVEVLPQRDVGEKRRNVYQRQPCRLIQDTCKACGVVDCTSRRTSMVWNSDAI